MRLSVLGMGNMGHALASQLLERGYDLTVWNRTVGKADDLVQRGAVGATTLEEAVQGAEVVLLSLTNDAAVRAVALDGGVAGGLPSGSVLVDMSTVAPETSRALGAAVPTGSFIDAPVLGGPHSFQTGKAKLLLGGDRAVIERLDPLWDDLSAGHYYTGENGTATTLKLLSNLILVGGTQLLMEAVATAQAHGFPDDILRDVFGGSPAVAPGVQVRLEDVLHGDHEGWWTLKLADKDLGLALKLAQSVGLDLPLTRAGEQLLARSIEAGYGEKDLGAMMNVLREKT
jgi:3-hydroxyisobutyrate dehydrogenase-like beta-hydroxyacid dehydrogenase